GVDSPMSGVILDHDEGRQHGTSAPMQRAHLSLRAIRRRPTPIVPESLDTSFIADARPAARLGGTREPVTRRLEALPWSLGQGNRKPAPGMDRGLSPFRVLRARKR